MREPVSFRREVYAALGVFALCLLVRWPHLSDSLWYDEMTTLAMYVLQPWHQVLAAGAGEYVPNNHVLHTVLAKLVYTLGTHGSDPLPPREALLRLPAVIAGSLVPIALAWPLRRREPLLALGIAIVTALNPWLVALSVEARGYTLMLLLGIIATNLLPERHRRWPVGYAIALALAVYTVPLAILLLPAHAAAMWIAQRSAFRSWLAGAGLALVFTTMLYAPMARGLLAYYAHPYQATMTYRQFWDALPRFALAGERLPQRSDPYLNWPDSPTDAVYWALPMLTIVIGSAFAWRRRVLRPMLLTWGTVTVLGVLLPLVAPGATEVRFVSWILLWFCICFVALLTSAETRFARFAAIAAMLTLVTWDVMTDVTLLPAQPIREAIHRADQLTPPGRQIIVLYLGARESIAVYGDQATAHRLIPAPDTASFIQAEKESQVATGHLPWVLIFYERLAYQRDHDAPESRGLWSELIRNYRPLLPRLPGRLAPATIYVPFHVAPASARPRPSL
jgi:uncharacterized membrane protein